MEEVKTVKGVLALKRYLAEQGIKISHPAICRHKKLGKIDLDEQGRIIINQKLMDLFEPLKEHKANGKSGRPLNFVRFMQTRSFLASFELC